MGRKGEIYLPAPPGLRGRAAGRVVLDEVFGLAKARDGFSSVDNSPTTGNIKRRPLERKEQGFSLIELLIVVAIILIIAAIAIPNFIRARMATNEASAVSSCRTINGAEVAYNSLYRGYSNNLAELGPPGGGLPTASAAGLIDSVLAAGIKSGYSFIYTPGPAVPASGVVNYQLNANPSTPGATGIRYFYSDGSGVIRQSTTGVASVASSPVQ